ncbi:polyprenyl synthetase family protein [Streptomyces chromofuscus]|uniref:Polyprenyl synthetase family protein n=1 Tax=Streptomyces chromofuscus TaxID=42881 RepID=A0A7M2TE46_STRCW|nr:polyprenyl synthetase family protein [Streptomyces chromofuscus]QOV46494.1 polyprenyl synthetase family protein [Streptomyces chromofuscus]GGS93828.1 geranylgeranyl pyrophosphate synthase [Streptomyces chromofuscus]
MRASHPTDRRAETADPAPHRSPGAPDLPHLQAPPDPAGAESLAVDGLRVDAVDRDVRAAVDRVLGHALADNLTRAATADPLFARDVARRVAHFTLDGGRRFRSRIVWWTMRACGGRDDAAARAALRVGAALELIQTCALAHDDVMDGARVRRGRPALHVSVAAQYRGAAPDGRAERLGEATAILAGDLALAWADDLIADTEVPERSARRVRELWRDMRTEMVAGQYLDVQGQATRSHDVPRALRAATLKSALYSVERPMALGAALAGADAATTTALSSAGRCVGLAFQLRDDLEDVFADPGRTGKPAGGDLRNGKPTYVFTVARAWAEAAGDVEALAVLDGTHGRADLPESGLASLRRVLVSTGARDAVEEKIDRLVGCGVRHLRDARLDGAGAAELERLLLAVAGVHPARPAGATRPPDDAGPPALAHAAEAEGAGR